MNSLDTAIARHQEDPTAVAAPTHYPADPRRFNFDEVAEFFQNMASRSIPDYERAHELHVRMLHPWMVQPGVSVLDVGTSRGRFIDHLAAEYGRARIESGDIQVMAIDSSWPMLEALCKRYPDVDVRCEDVSSDTFVYCGGVEKYDVICAFYVLQFIHPGKQLAVLRRLMALLKPNGVLILGQKSATGGLLAGLANEQYIEWRKANGYTQEEIDRKTAALRHSMWPMDHSEVLNTLREQMREVFETTRTGAFNTLMARK